VAEVVAVMEAAETVSLAVMLVAPEMAPASVMPPLLLSMPPVKEEGPAVAVMDAAEKAPVGVHEWRRRSKIGRRAPHMRLDVNRNGKQAKCLCERHLSPPVDTHPWLQSS
jgi:hypothetical protein